MKLTLMFVLIIATFSNFAATESISRTSAVEKTLKNSLLEARALECPSGTYECSDSEGACCPYGTICLPNFRCSGGKPSGSGGSKPSGSGSKPTTISIPSISIPTISKPTALSSGGITLETSPTISQIFSILLAYLYLA
jgi:hypothetical protein